MTCGIYSITNTVCGRTYIGQSKNAEKRWRAHRHNLRAGTHGNIRLQRAWNRDGEASFVFSIVEECDVSALTERESFHVRRCPKRYNFSDCVDAPTRGRRMPKWLKKKISASLKGRKKSAATRRRMRAPKSKAHRRAIGAAQIGRVQKQETRVTISRAMGGSIVIGANEFMTVSFNTLQDAARAGYNPGHISECLRGHRKRHRGMSWRRG